MNINYQQSNWHNHLMFFQNNTRSKLTIAKNEALFFHQFNPPKVQWHSGNIGYQQCPSVAVKTCRLWIRKARVLDFFLPAIWPFQKQFFKEYFFSGIVDFGVPFSINFFSSSAVLGFRKALEQDAMSSLVSFVRRLEISKHVWDLIFLHNNFIRNVFFVS